MYICAWVTGDRLEKRRHFSKSDNKLTNVTALQQEDSNVQLREPKISLNLTRIADTVCWRQMLKNQDDKNQKGHLENKVQFTPKMNFFVSQFLYD